MASVKKVETGWRARWRTPDGRSRSKTFTRKLDAERHLTSVEHSKLIGAYIDPAAGRTTVQEYWDVWSERQPWRTTSRLSVTSLFSMHVLPALGQRALSTLRRGEIETWAARLPLAGRTSRQIAGYLGTMLEAAAVDGLIMTNPARGAKRPRVEAHPVVPFTAEEIAALSAAAPAWFAVALTLGLGAGLRQAEATGLTVDRVDFLRRQLTVDRQLIGVDDVRDPLFGPPKTERSYRTVPLADVTIEALARHLDEHRAGRKGLVLHHDGAPMTGFPFGYTWRKLRDRAELPAARYHDTRHTFASVLLSGGVSVPATADYLGHTPAVLLTTYAHLMPVDHDRARSAGQAALVSSCVTSVSRAVDKRT
jgi:integrase